MPKKNPPPQVVAPGDAIAVRFDAVAHSGAAKGTPVDPALAHLIVFCPGMAPGDVAAVVVASAEGRYVTAIPDPVAPRTVDSPLRAKPQCPVFGQCGGCDFQHIDAAEQPRFKQEFVEYRLRRTLPDLPAIEPCVRSPGSYGYRHRLDVWVESRSENVAIGFMEKASNDLVPIDACPIASDCVSRQIVPLCAALGSVRLGARLRMRIVADETTASVIALPASEDEREVVTWALLNETGEPDPAAWRRIETVPDFEQSGDGYALRYHPSCFTQVNPDVNRKLIDAVRLAVGAREGLKVLELFSGIGNFTIPLARAGASVTAVESDDLAARHARASAMRLGLDRVEIKTLTAQGACAQARSRKDRYDVVLLDPPRAGVGEKTVRDVCELRPMRVVYVSCDLDALANDLKVFDKQGYRVRRVTPFDMFPQTRHVEVLVALGLI